MNNTVKIDIISDIVCPWCIIGYNHLKAAINELGIEDRIDIEWQPFELNPDMPAEG
ncbi:DsbA family protein, partial [Vibrio parahaemolyticus]